jgi:hypothetical protein
VDADEKRDEPGCSVSLSEAEVHWRAFLLDLKDRSLHSIELMVSDALEGLQAARKAVFGSVPAQAIPSATQYRPVRAAPGHAICRRCGYPFHLQRTGSGRSQASAG